MYLRNVNRKPTITTPASGTRRAGTGLCRGSIEPSKQKQALGYLTITVIMGTSGGVLVICQDRCHHELSPPIDGLFTQRRDVAVEIWFQVGRKDDVIVYGSE